MNRNERFRMVMLAFFGTAIRMAKYLNSMMDGKSPTDKTIGSWCRGDTPFNDIGVVESLAIIGINPGFLIGSDETMCDINHSEVEVFETVQEIFKKVESEKEGGK